MTEYTLASETARTAVAATDIIPIATSGGTLGSVTPALLISGAAAPVTVTAGATTLTVTQALHGNRPIILNNTATITITLPQATGTGTKYIFYVNAAATATASVIKVANATDNMKGSAAIVSTTSSTVLYWVATATDDTISINGSTKGGLVGDVIEITDMGTGIFSALCKLATTGAAATVFSATV